MSKKEGWRREEERVCVRGEVSREVSPTQAASHLST